ncbi:hypothetical protein NDU88_001906 [Pleurodeles waltl]|uniref:Uncharacterized protein n=1 Tax=Pleurodeles waltl TaxID=8319 RepID=A0AAV7LAY7_PLEWA|nr:hypothetical protein NDU88_001906 [Pleurodeles waltl]
MTSNVMYVGGKFKWTDAAAARRDAEDRDAAAAKRDAEDRDAAAAKGDAKDWDTLRTGGEQDERQNAHHNGASPREADEHREGRAMSREPPAPGSVKSGDRQAAGRVPGGAWPTERSLHSNNLELAVILTVRKSRQEGRTFSYLGPKHWNPNFESLLLALTLP